jgi:hypothetical protein
MEEFDGILGLWEQAAEWGRDHKNFRRWWIRAAMADGHAEWLEKEKYYQYGWYNIFPAFKSVAALALSSRDSNTKSNPALGGLEIVAAWNSRKLRPRLCSGIW